MQEEAIYISSAADHRLADQTVLLWQILQAEVEQPHQSASHAQSIEGNYQLSAPVHQKPNLWVSGGG